MKAYLYGIEALCFSDISDKESVGLFLNDVLTATFPFPASWFNAWISFSHFPPLTASRTSRTHWIEGILFVYSLQFGLPVVSVQLS
jgi:hypothetical protein